MECPVKLVPKNIQIYENFINRSINTYRYDENEISIYYRSQTNNKKEMVKNSFG